MSEASEKLELGNIFEETVFEVFSWKIPNVSSITLVANCVIQSPVFYFGGTPWTVKLYPYGQTKEGTEGYIDITIERLQTQNRVMCRLCHKGVFDDEVNEKIRILDRTVKTTTVYRYINIKELSEIWQFALDDTFTLLFKFGLKDDKSKNKSDSQMASVKTTMGESHAVSENGGKTVLGEIYKELFKIKSFYWKINGKPSWPIPADLGPSPQFNFMNATWVLKIKPKEANKPSFDVLLQRLHSEVPAHHIILKINFYYPPSKNAEKDFFFNACCTEGDGINFQSKKLNETSQKLYFVIEIKGMKIGGIGLEPRMKSANRALANDKKSTNKVLQDLKDLFLKKEDCDVIFKVKEQEFPAHRAILKARSPVLASVFRNNMKEKATGIIDIEDCDPIHFSDFLHFLYCGEVESLTVENVFSLFTVADKYDVQDLRNICFEFMKCNLSIDTFCDTIALALLHSEAELVKLCTDFFAKNLQNIVLTVKWQSFITENPIQGNELYIKALGVK